MADKIDVSQRLDDFSHLREALAPLMRNKHFTAICLCFAVQDESQRPYIIDRLTQGLEQLAIGFPWLAGEVDGEEGTGLPKVFAGKRKCTLIVKDLTIDEDFPSMQDLRKASFPFSMLDGSLITPTEGLPTGWTDPPVPVFIVQANFIKGGLLLTLVGEHSSMDGVGLGRVLRILSEACHGIPFTEEQLRHGNSARTNIIHPLEQSAFEAHPRLDYMLMTPEARAAFANYQKPETTWAYLHFPASSLATFKRLASVSDSFLDEPKVPYTTTNDAVTAFIWKTIARTRAARLPSDATCMLVRAVDARSCLSISPYYLGNITQHTYTRLPVSSADSTSLNALATSLRLALNPEDLARRFRAVLNLLATTEDISEISYGANFNITSDIWFSSWAKLDCYHLDFNLGLGFPEAVRKPRSDGVECLGYLMPMDREGGLDAAICLRNEDVEVLRKDYELREYAEWIG